jgi:hypothetical protein
MNKWLSLAGGLLGGYASPVLLFIRACVTGSKNKDDTQA